MVQQLPAFGNKSDIDHWKRRISQPRLMLKWNQKNETKKEDRKDVIFPQSAYMHNHLYTGMCKWIQAHLHIESNGQNLL